MIVKADRIRMRFHHEVSVRCISAIYECAAYSDRTMLIVQEALTVERHCGHRIHNIKDKDKKTDSKGETTFGSLGKNVQGKDVLFANVATIYDWVDK